MSGTYAKLVSITPKAEETMAYCARVSNPKNQENPDYADLLSYCIRHGHWSVFEQANMVVEIRTSRAVSPQLLRHRSFSFQEFSQRYATVHDYIPQEARRQGASNRQSSVDDLDAGTRDWFLRCQEEVWQLAQARYQEALGRGVARECARALLPLSAATRLYMNGTIRSWIHYIQLRTAADTQLEHRRVAEECREILAHGLPQVARALGWTRA